MFSPKGLGDILPPQLPSVGFEDLSAEYDIPQTPGPNAPNSMSISPAELAIPQGYLNPTYQSAPSPGQPPPGPVNPGNLSTYAVPYGAPLVPQHGQVLPGVPFGYQQGAPMMPMPRQTLGNTGAAATGSWTPWIITFLALGAAGGVGFLMWRQQQKGKR